MGIASGSDALPDTGQEAGSTLGVPFGAVLGDFCFLFVSQRKKGRFCLVCYVGEATPSLVLLAKKKIGSGNGRRKSKSGKRFLWFQRNVMKNKRRCCVKMLTALSDNVVL